MQSGSQYPMINNFIAFAHLRSEFSGEFYFLPACFYKNCGCVYLNNCFCILKKYPPHFKCFILENSLMHTCQIYIYSTNVTFFILDVRACLSYVRYLHKLLHYFFLCNTFLFMWFKYIL